MTPLMIYNILLLSIPPVLFVVILMLYARYRETQALLDATRERHADVSSIQSELIAELRVALRQKEQDCHSYLDKIFQMQSQGFRFVPDEDGEVFVMDDEYELQVSQYRANGREAERKKALTPADIRLELE
jgi:hypothetical protein